MVNAALLIVATVLSASPVSAARPNQAHPPGVDCSGQATQADLNACAARDLLEAQRRLAGLLEELRRTLEPARWRELEAVQRSWQLFAEAHCRWEGAGFEGGSIRPMWESNCRTALTEERVGHLAIQLCEGAGLTSECEASDRYLRRPAEPPDR